MTTMDFWYERTLYEMADLNAEATELRREAGEALSPRALAPAEEDEE
jgi:hypothetical protein